MGENNVMLICWHFHTQEIRSCTADIFFWWPETVKIQSTLNCNSIKGCVPHYVHSCSSHHLVRRTLWINMNGMDIYGKKRVVCRITNTGQIKPERTHKLLSYYRLVQSQWKAVLVSVLCRLYFFFSGRILYLQSSRCLRLLHWSSLSARAKINTRYLTNDWGSTKQSYHTKRILS